jgi:hypothetical protein
LGHTNKCPTFETSPPTQGESLVFDDVDDHGHEFYLVPFDAAYKHLLAPLTGRALFVTNIEPAENKRHQPSFSFEVGSEKTWIVTAAPRGTFKNSDMRHLHQTERVSKETCKVVDFRIDLHVYLIPGEASFKPSDLQAVGFVQHGVQYHPVFTAGDYLGLTRDISTLPPDEPGTEPLLDEENRYVAFGPGFEALNEQAKRTVREYGLTHADSLESLQKALKTDYPSVVVWCLTDKDELCARTIGMLADMRCEGDRIFSLLVMFVVEEGCRKTYKNAVSRWKSFIKRLRDAAEAAMEKRTTCKTLEIFVVPYAKDEEDATPETNVNFLRGYLPFLSGQFINGCLFLDWAVAISDKYIDLDETQRMLLSSDTGLDTLAGYRSQKETRLGEISILLIQRLKEVARGSPEEYQRLVKKYVPTGMFATVNGERVRWVRHADYLGQLKDLAKEMHDMRHMISRLFYDEIEDDSYDFHVETSSRVKIIF